MEEVVVQPKDSKSSSVDEEIDTVVIKEGSRLLPYYAMVSNKPISTPKLWKDPMFFEALIYCMVMIIALTQKNLRSQMIWELKFIEKILVQW